jgi:hypothetical protein
VRIVVVRAGVQPHAFRVADPLSGGIVRFSVESAC